MLPAARDLLIFVLLLGGPALALAPLIPRSDPLARLSLALGLTLVALYLTAFGLYAADLPFRWFALVPVLGWLAAVARHRASREFCGRRTVRAATGRWLLLALWCLGWAALVVNYSGGGWCGDWQEHYDRAQFFLMHWPRNAVFLHLYPLPARPPLANLNEAGFLALAGGAFWHHQIFLTLLSTLCFFPLAHLVGRRDGSPRAQALLLLLLCASPLVVQNATFAWTKLPAAFFILLAAAELSRSGRDIEPGRILAGALALAAGLLVHYSAGPWIVGLGLAWLWQTRGRWRDGGIARETLLATVLAAALLATWFGWSIAQYGVTETFTANSTVALAPGGGPAERAGRAAANLFWTFCPAVTLGIRPDVLVQSSQLGQWRDFWFCLYQLNLPLSLGTAGWLVLLWKTRRDPAAKIPGFWWLAAVPVVILGTAAHGAPDLLGLTHIALQPLVLLGLAALAAGAERLPGWLARLWAAALALDCVLGILMHFSLQALWPDRWLHPSATPTEILSTYTRPAALNFRAKQDMELVFLADRIPAVPVLCAVAIIALMILHGWNRHRGARPAG